MDTMKMARLLVCALALASCGDTADDSGGLLCGSTQGFVYGVVRLSDGTAATDATVTAVDIDPGELGSVDGEMAGDGSYELNVEGHHTWEITAQAGGCTSDATSLSVVECNEYELDLDIAPCE